jgi:hypothetical protein
MHVDRPCSLSQADLACITALLDHCRSLYLDELQDELWLKRGVHITLPTIHCALQQLGVSRKVISAVAFERNEMSQVIYINHIAKEAPNAGMLMFVDEATKNECMLSCRYGCSGKGVRCMVQRWFVRGLHYSIVPVITLDGIIVYDIVDNSVNGDHFYNFIKELVVIILFFIVLFITYNHLVQMLFTNPYPGPHSVLIMNNCRIHHGEWLCQLVEDVHCKYCLYIEH